MSRPPTGPMTDENNDDMPVTVAALSAEYPLYKSEQEIAARIGVGVKRWKSFAKTFERDGLPKPNPVIGKRYWPAIRKFLDAMEGVGQGGIQYDHRAKENFDVPRRSKKKPRWSDSHGA